MTDAINGEMDALIASATAPDHNAHVQDYYFNRMQIALRNWKNANRR